MEEYATDEIIEELRKVKDSFSSYCNRNIREIVKRIDEIAEIHGFKKKETNYIEKFRAA